MGGHDLKHPDVPDWRIYRVEDVPELMKVKEKLERRGLKYPWLRNEVWKYTKHPIESSLLQAWKFTFFGKGFKYGVAAGIATIIAEKAYNMFTEKSVAESGEGHH